MQFEHFCGQQADRVLSEVGRKIGNANFFMLVVALKFPQKLVGRVLVLKVN